MRREPAAGESPYFFFPYFFFFFFVILMAPYFLKEIFPSFLFVFCYFFFLYESEVVIRKRTKRPKGNNCLVHVTYAFLVFGRRWCARLDVQVKRNVAFAQRRLHSFERSFTKEKMKEKMREKVIMVKSARLPFAPLRLSVVFISLSFALLQNVIVSLFFFVTLNLYSVY